MRALEPLRRAVRGARRAGRLNARQFEAVVALADWAEAENLGPRRAPTIDPTAMISPLASLRFVERVEIGPKASIGPWCCIWGGWSRTWARVGAGALLSPGVILVSGNHRIDTPGPVREQGFIELDVSIGAGAWIGAHAVVVGVSVGENAVVGAGAVVLEDVPANAIAVGSPAKVVGWREGHGPAA
ncbi:MAG: acyltransferase [Solirubrobacteraceae bacterium]